MSRIHEALKKAEQDRAAVQGGGSSRTVEPADISTAAPVPDGLGTATPSPLSGVPSFSPAFTVDSLLARSVRSNWSPDIKTMLFFSSDEHAYGTEEFRTLRSRLYQMREKHPLKKVLVTSSLPKEGKTFVAANLAQVLVRQHGRRALLIDADLRAARLHSALGTSASPGLAEYLLGEADEFGTMQRGAMENLFFIPSGRKVSNPAELVANGRLKFLLNRVEPLFDWIIIDSPPAVPVSDGQLLANYCDGVLLVVRSHVTPFDIARKACQEFNDRHIIGVVLNGIDATASPYTQYYYGTYGKPNGKEPVQR